MYILCISNILNVSQQENIKLTLFFYFKVLKPESFIQPVYYWTI